MDALWIPIAGILVGGLAIMVGGFTEWLKFKAKQQQLGTSAHELERQVERLEFQLAASEDRQKALTGRIQNLEAIVTTQVWDAVNDSSLPLPEKERRLAEAQSRILIPEEEPAAEKAERLARRLQV